ncbi:MAG TPA: hypothetical protein DGX96_07375 [Lachnospiraceae bacterium]|nr:hypothetical protein [Lachnospiraceae bacterium]
MSEQEVKTEDQAVQEESKAPAEQAAPVEETENPSMKDSSSEHVRPVQTKKKKKHHWVRWVVILAIIAALVAFFAVRSRQAQQALYTEDTVTKRDIQTYHSFTGTVEAINEQTIASEVTGVKIESVEVKKGDDVKAGDTIATLDTDSVEEQIKESEATLDKAKATAQDSIDQAKQQYDQLAENRSSGLNTTVQSAKQQLESAESQYNNLKYNIDNNLDSTLQQAQNGMNSAYTALLTAMNAYNNEVNLNNQQLSQQIMSAQQSVDQAYANVTSAQLSLSQAQQNRTHSEETFNENKNKASSSSSLSSLGGSYSDDTSSSTYDPTSYDQAVASAQNALNSAWQTYNNAVDSYKAAKIGEENSLTSLYDQMLQAQDSYLQAVDSYNATVNSLNQQLATYAKQVSDAQDSYNAAVNAVDQQLETYQSQIDSAKTNADQTTSELQLRDLKKSLGKYVITAPIDGTVTDLGIKAGEILGQSTTSPTIGTISDFSSVKVSVKIGEYDIQGCEVGSPVTVTIDALNDKAYDGTITYISRVATVENGVSYFESEVEFTPDSDVRSGMSCEVKLVTADEKDALSLSSKAIQTADDGTTYVQVYGDDGRTLINKDVTIGISDGTYTQILDGLSEGDKVYYINSATSLQDMMQQDEAVNDGGDTEGGQ